ncbi:DUF4304 domain-containing protein [Winogradskyella sp.]|uniref:DUF4304 domain-containing protein n=1 Tax=Winogradskyella sp. TaxID=1883156 RepID=UPI0035159267
MKSKNTEVLNKIQNLITDELKEKGLSKSGRTYNSTIEKGLVHVVNFQNGKRSMQGKFTVNLGVYIEELDEVKSNNSTKKEYDCAIRVRLKELISNKDVWYNLNEDFHKTSHRITKDLKQEGMEWFELFNSREKIIQNLQKKSIGNFKNRNRAILDAALIQLNFDTNEGTKIFKDYFNSIKNNTPHKDYVARLANVNGIDIGYSASDEGFDFLKSLLK